HAEAAVVAHAHTDQIEITRLENTQRHDAVGKDHGWQRQQCVVEMGHGTLLVSAVTLPCVVCRCRRAWARGCRIGAHANAYICKGNGLWPKPPRWYRIC